MSNHFRIAQEHGIWNVYSIRRPTDSRSSRDKVIGQYLTLEQAERQVEEWTSNLTAGEEHIMDQTGHISRYRIAPYPDPDAPWAIFGHSNPTSSYVIAGYPTREECEAKLDEMDRSDMAEIDSQEWAKQALSEWLNQVAAKYGLQPNEILYDVRFGIEYAFDELGFPKLG